MTGSNLTNFLCFSCYLLWILFRFGDMYGLTIDSIVLECSIEKCPNSGLHEELFSFGVLNGLYYCLYEGLILDMDKILVFVEDCLYQGTSMASRFRHFDVFSQVFHLERKVTLVNFGLYSGQLIFFNTLETDNVIYNYELTRFYSVI